MSKFKDIIELLEKNNFNEALNKLNHFNIESEDDIIKVNYLKALIYSDFNNKNRSAEKAKKFFGYVVESNNPIENAFFELAKIEKDKEKSKSILKKGLDKFPESICLYEYLLVLSSIEERYKIFEEIKLKSLSSTTIQLIKIQSYFIQKEYLNTINIIEEFEANSEIDNYLYKILMLIKGFSFLCTGVSENCLKAKNIFQGLVDNDLLNSLCFGQYIGLALCCLEENDIDNVIHIIDRMPNDVIVEGIYIPWEYVCYDFTEIYLESFNKLERAVKSNKLIHAKIRGLRGLFLYSSSEQGCGIQINSKVIKDLEYANKYFPNVVKYSKTLCYIYIEKKDCYKAYRFYMQYIENINDLDNIISCEECINIAENEEFSLILDDFMKKLQNGLAFEVGICKTVLNPIIERLFEMKDYKQIVIIASSFSRHSIKNSDVIFEIAYSYKENKDRESAKFFYEMCIEKGIAGSGVYNNLGIIYEEEGDLDKAKELVEKALSIDSNNEMAKKNAKRIDEAIKQRNKYAKELKQALESFDKETIYIKEKILKFSQHKNEKNLIVCPYRQLPQFLEVPKTKAIDFLNSFLEKKYILKITDHNIDTSASVYMINPEIQKWLDDYKQKIDDEEELLNIANRFNTESFDEVGYDSSLLSCLNKIKNVELQKMLERDLRENVYALITGAYKTSLILSGSIIEAILLDKIRANNIDSFTLENGRNKKVVEMDLNELLYVANNKKLINSEHYHFSHAIRSYRNLIHPGVEYRKSTVPITEENARLIWNILKKILVEL